MLSELLFLLKSNHGWHGDVPALSKGMDQRRGVSQGRDLRVFVIPGLWTLDWTMDWTGLDWNLKIRFCTLRYALTINHFRVWLSLLPGTSAYGAGAIPAIAHTICRKKGEANPGDQASELHR